MTKALKHQALTLSNLMRYFTGLAVRLKSSILLMVGVLVLLTMTEVMADPKDSTNWQKLTLQGISLTILLKVT